MSKQESALDLLARLSVEDLESDIAQRETALAEIVAEHRREIDALAVLLKAALIKRDGKVKRGPKAKGAKAANGKAENPNRIRIADWLAKHPPATVGDIARALSLPPGPVSRLVDHDWFVRLEDDLVTLARAG